MLEERIKRMREAGIPMPITQVSLNEGGVSAAPITPQNADKHARLQALKSGANKQQIQQLVKSEASTGPGGFKPIPEPSFKKNPNNPQNKISSPDKLVKPLENLVPYSPVNNELKMIEDLMAGGSSVVSPIPHNQQSNFSENTTIIPDNYGPEFNPMAILKSKQELKSKNQYMQYALSQPEEDFVEPSNQQNFDFQNMKAMMEQIAKNTISEVLNSYTEKNNSKLTFEYTTMKASDGNKVIKTSDGNYFKVIPVKVKKN